MSEPDPHPTDYATIASFKAAWYDEHEVGTWLDDIMLSIMYYEHRDEELPDGLAEIKAALEDSDD